MKAIIFLVSRSRVHIPRVGGFVLTPDLAQYTHPWQPFVFEGRLLDVGEFNEAAARLLDVRNPHMHYEVSVRMFDDTPAATDEEEPLPWDEPGTAPETPQNVEDAAQDTPADNVTQDAPEALETPAAAQESPFSLDGGSIMLEGIRIAGLYGESKQLRVLSEYQSLRPSIEAWLASQS